MTTPRIHRLTTEWSTHSPVLAESLRLIASLPEYSADRMEAEAALHMYQARLCWRDADRYRAQERKKEAKR